VHHVPLSGPEPNLEYLGLMYPPSLVQHVTPVGKKKQKSTSISYFALQAMLSVNIIIIIYETNEFLLLFYIVVLDNF